eukprot:8463884-Alexandrium_andersonii.AAC.1
MGDARVLTEGDQALASDVERLLVLWQQKATRGKHLSGLPVYGSLGINLGGHLVFSSQNGKTLGNVAAQA